jgi:hypothetical protein
VFNPSLSDGTRVKDADRNEGYKETNEDIFNVHGQLLIVCRCLDRRKRGPKVTQKQISNYFTICSRVRGAGNPSLYTYGFHTRTYSIVKALVWTIRAHATSLLQYHCGCYECLSERISVYKFYAAS